MPTISYIEQRKRVETYFDHTALEAWSRLTSDAPVGRIRATVRAGRDRMRETLVSWLPDDMHGLRLLDAGCGTGALAIEAARRGADVTAVDVSPKLIALASQRSVGLAGLGHVRFVTADMLDPKLGTFDHVVAMDSLIHYERSDMVKALALLSRRCRRSMLFTFAPRTPMLALMHVTGRLFPRANRAPAIEPVAEGQLRRDIATDARLATMPVGRSAAVVSGFYLSQALELARP